jgi:hypothetical protein
VAEAPAVRVNGALPVIVGGVSIRIAADWTPFSSVTEGVAFPAAEPALKVFVIVPPEGTVTVSGALIEPSGPLVNVILRPTSTAGVGEIVAPFESFVTSAINVEVPVEGRICVGDAVSLRSRRGSASTAAFALWQPAVPEAGKSSQAHQLLSALLVPPA